MNTVPRRWRLASLLMLPWLLALGCAQSAEAPPSRLPLVEMPVPGSDRLVILMSGDGGWRALVRGMSAEFNRQGISVLGWNSLRYFWRRKTPEQAAADLASAIETYRQRWQVSEVVLVGYSFGADVMPFLYNRLPPEQRSVVRFVALLGLAPQADFHAKAGGWLGLGRSDGLAVLPQVERMPAARLQCIQGRQERDSLCPQLRTLGVAVVAAEGGHHFDGDAKALARYVEDGWRQAPALR